MKREALIRTVTAPVSSTLHTSLIFVTQSFLHSFCRQVRAREQLLDVTWGDLRDVCATLMAAVHAVQSEVLSTGPLSTHHTAVTSPVSHLRLAAASGAGSSAVPSSVVDWGSCREAAAAAVALVSGAGERSRALLGSVVAELESLRARATERSEAAARLAQDLAAAEEKLAGKEFVLVSAFDLPSCNCQLARYSPECAGRCSWRRSWPAGEAGSPSGGARQQQRRKARGSSAVGCGTAQNSTVGPCYRDAMEHAGVVWLTAASAWNAGLNAGSRRRCNWHSSRCRNGGSD